MSTPAIKIVEDKSYIDPAKMQEAWDAYLLGEVLKRNKTAPTRLGQVEMKVSFGTGAVQCAVLRGQLRGDNPSLALLGTILAPTRHYFLVVINDKPYTLPYAVEVIRPKDDDVDLAFHKMLRHGGF